MNMRTFVTSLAVGCAAMILAAMTISPQDPAEMEAAWAEAMEKFAAPSVEHSMLAKRVGQWQASTKFWMDPNDPPQVHEGESTIEMIMDGRYTPGPDGKEFKSMEITYTRSDSEASDPADQCSDRAILKEIVVDATLEQVWHAWTTPEGLSTFLSGQSNVDLRIGGAYELFQDVPPDKVGKSGTAGCSVLSYIPFEMLSFEWGFRPDIPHLRYRGVRTHVVLRFDPLDENTTRVRLAHLGWYRGEDWDRAFGYFEKEWVETLERLRDSFNDEVDGQVMQHSIKDGTN